MKDISILIPTYNGVCTQLVNDLCQQAQSLALCYEIIVADDGSTNIQTVNANRSINEQPCCRYIERDVNSGRAAIRNFLASEAQYEWLLFIDCDMMVCDKGFLLRYVNDDCQDSAYTKADNANYRDAVIYGGVTIGRLVPHNLRSIYEKASEQEHTVSKRRQSPYHDFHTANFLVRRDIMLAYPFDMRFRHYGYEDVLFGKTLEEHGIAIRHIDNPLRFEKFESNADFVSKTEEGLRTLYEFRHELRGYSRLLDTLVNTPKLLLSLLRLWHKHAATTERRNLSGPHPRLLLFKVYKAGYLQALLDKQ